MPPDHLDHARLYERLGLRIFPVARLIRGDDGVLTCSCHSGPACDAPGKHPVFSGWREAAAGATIWDNGPLAKPNVGIITGAPSGIVVLDIDPRNGGDETLAALEEQHGLLPPTWRFLTGGGGEHILLRHPGGHVKSLPGALGSGLDVKADGGLIVAPPSLHVSGRRYAISVDHHPDDVPLAPPPGWLSELLEPPVQPRARVRVRAARPVRPSRGLSRYGEAALDNACRRILAAANGSQECTINAEAFSIGRLAGAGAVPAGFALRALQWAADRVGTYDSSRPWRGGQLAAKVERSFDAGLANPRQMRRR